MGRAFELRATVTAYDACYVALAEALEWPLCTDDRRLANASGPRLLDATDYTPELIGRPFEKRRP